MPVSAAFIAIYRLHYGLFLSIRSSAYITESLASRAPLRRTLPHTAGSGLMTILALRT